MLCVRQEEGKAAPGDRGCRGFQSPGGGVERAPGHARHLIFLLSDVTCFFAIPFDLTFFQIRSDLISDDLI